MTDYAIIGDGAAGSTAAFWIRRTDPQAKITIYCDDPNPTYYRAALTNYLVGELRAEQLFAVPPNFYSESNVERILTRVDGVDTKEQRLRLSNGQNVAYDQLMIAAGSRARMPQFPGANLEGVMPMRTMQDGRYCLDLINSNYLKRGIIVGGGILGIEWVAGLRARGCDATFIIREPAFWVGIIDQAASDLVLSRCRFHGVDVRTEEEVGEVIGKGGKFRGVKLKNSGDTVHGEILGMAIGIVPNIEFLKDSDVKTNKGVPVDDHMRTNVQNVYAGGDIAEVTDPILNRSYVMGLWEPARHHGRVAGINMAGGSETWTMGVSYNATRLYDLDLAAVGDVIEKPTDDVLIDFPAKGGRISYKKLIFRDNKLVGALLLGQRKEKTRARGRQLHQVVSSGVDISGVRDQLLDPFFDIATWLQSLSNDGPTPAPPGLRAKDPDGTSKPSVAAMLGKVAPEIGGAPLISASARANLATLMRPTGSAASMTKHSPASTYAMPSRPGAITAGGPGRPAAATLKLVDGSLLSLADLVTIGRRPGNTLVLEDPAVDDVHAEIRREGTSFVVADMKSVGETFVNEEPVTEPRVLRHGDTIRIAGHNFTFVQQVMAPRAETGPAGLPDEPLGPTKDASDRVLGTVEMPGKSFPVKIQETDIGQDPRSEIFVNDPSVSYLHAQISRQGDALYLRDLGSRNGTYVNGKLSTIPHLLQDGDVIRVGSTEMTFRGIDRASGPARKVGAGADVEPIPTPEPVVPSATKKSTPEETFVQPTGGALSKATDKSTYFEPIPTEDLPEPTPASGSPGNASQGARLVGIGGPVNGREFPLGSGGSLGSGPKADIQIGDAGLAGDHVRFRLKGKNWMVTDAAGKGLTTLDEQQMPPKMQILLEDGAVIKAGEAVFRFEAGSPDD